MSHKKSLNESPFGLDLQKPVDFSGSLMKRYG